MEALPRPAAEEPPLTRSSCSTCKGRRRLINRDGLGLVPLEPGDPPTVTAKMMKDFYLYVVKVGEVCPCPDCCSIHGRVFE